MAGTSNGAGVPPGKSTTNHSANINGATRQSSRRALAPPARNNASAPIATSPEVPSVTSTANRAGARMPPTPGSTDSQWNGARADPPSSAGVGPSDSRKPVTAIAGNSHARRDPWRRLSLVTPTTPRAMASHPR